jgi:hypothetical protein
LKTKTRFLADFARIFTIFEQFNLLLCFLSHFSSLLASRQHFHWNKIARLKHCDASYAVSHAHKRRRCLYCSSLSLKAKLRFCVLPRCWRSAREDHPPLLVLLVRRSCPKGELWTSKEKDPLAFPRGIFHEKSESKVETTSKYLPIWMVPGFSKFWRFWSSKDVFFMGTASPQGKKTNHISRTEKMRGGREVGG